MNPENRRFCVSGELGCKNQIEEMKFCSPRKVVLRDETFSIG